MYKLFSEGNGIEVQLRLISGYKKKYYNLRNKPGYFWT